MLNSLVTSEEHKIDNSVNKIAPEGVHKPWSRLYCQHINPYTFWSVLLITDPRLSVLKQKNHKSLDVCLISYKASRGNKCCVAESETKVLISFLALKKKVLKWLLSYNFKCQYHVTQWRFRFYAPVNVNTPRIPFNHGH